MEGALATSKKGNRTNITEMSKIEIFILLAGIPCLILLGLVLHLLMELWDKLRN